MAKATVGKEKPKNHRSQSGVPGEEGEEIKSPKRKTVRVESEETQVYAREAKDTDQEEAEELSFSPSAISVPRKPKFRCDNQCSEKTLSFWQLASVVKKEGKKSYTTNLCQRWQWRQVVEKKAYRGRIWRMMGKEQYVRGMWEHFLQERARVRQFRERAEEEQQAGIQGQWQLESPAKEFTEQVKRSDDTDSTHRMMKQGFVALESGDWEESKSIFRAETESHGMGF